MSAKPETIKCSGREWALHPACALFPVMDDEALRKLADDIKANGLRMPAVEHDGAILDGRNRMLACDLAGIAPTVKPWDGKGGSPTAYALSVNLERRHLTTGQRAAIAVASLPMFEAEAKARQEASRAKPGEKVGSPSVGGGEKNHALDSWKSSGKGKSSDHAAKAAGVSASSVKQAKRIGKKSKKLLGKVAAGTTTLHAAAKKASGKVPPTQDEQTWMDIRRDVANLISAFERGLINGGDGTVDDRGLYEKRILRAAVAVESKRFTANKIQLPADTMSRWAETAKRVSKGLAALAKAAKEL